MIKYSGGNRGTVLLAPLNESSWFLSPFFFPPLFFIKTNMATVLVKKVVFNWRGKDEGIGRVCEGVIYGGERNIPLVCPFRVSVADN